MTTALRTVGLTFARPGGRGPVLDDITIAVEQGEFVALVGQNGCGKSTLLHLLAGLARPTSGEVLVTPPGEREAQLRTFSRRAIARNISIMHQHLAPIPGLLVRQLVQQGGYARRGPFGMLSTARTDEVEEALDLVGLTGWGDRVLDELSGGERQRVRLALALAQRAPVLLLDEPTAHLDIHHQLAILQLVRSLQQGRGLTVVAVLHDLDHAARFADRVIALSGGHVHSDGPPDEVITARLLADVFAVSGDVTVERGRLRTSIDAPLEAHP